MKHRVAGRQLSRNSGHRRALLRNLVTSLIENGRIETTVPKAKEVRKIAEPIITKSIKGDLHSIRLVNAYVYTKSAVGKLFNEIAPRMKGRPGGYLRILKTRVRPGDSAPMAIVEFVDQAEAKDKAETKSEGKPAGKTSAKTATKTSEKPKKAAPKPQTKEKKEAAAATEEKPKKKAAPRKKKAEASATA